MLWNLNICRKLTLLNEFKSVNKCKQTLQIVVAEQETNSCIIISDYTKFPSFLCIEYLHLLLITC